MALMEEGKQGHHHRSAIGRSYYLAGNKEMFPSPLARIKMNNGACDSAPSPRKAPPAEDHPPMIGEGEDEDDYSEPMMSWSACIWAEIK